MKKPMQQEPRKGDKEPIWTGSGTGGKEPGRLRP